MNRSEKYFKTLRGLLLLAVAALVAGCGNGGKSTGASTGNQAAEACNCVPLGAAGNYAILARLGISTPLLTETITPTVVTGNVGLSPNPELHHRIFIIGCDDVFHLVSGYWTSICI